MAIGKGPTEGGSGGKRGHANMGHRDYTEAIKVRTRLRRRREDRRSAAQGIKESRQPARPAGD
ncbi:MAG: hypothetical protein K9L70_06000 [Thiohalocapsa sp.]|nr:hypothetical protein [Thiohalocapsa sp.]